MVIVPFTRNRDLRGPKEPTLSGYKLQLTSKVKCLGLSLDNELTWKAQLENVINMAYRTFWVGKGTFGKTWALKPGVLYWIHTKVIKLILTYSSMVRWSRVRFTVNRMELNKLQRLACLAITGVTRTTPTGAVVVLLGFLPQHVVPVVEAQAGIYRPKCNHQWKLKSTMATLTSLRTWRMNPSYLQGQIKWYQNMHIKSHSRFSFLTSMKSRMGLTQIIKEAWSGI